MRIETKRLILRPFEEGDLADVYAYGSEDGGPEAAGWAHFASIKEAEEKLHNDIPLKNKLAVERKSDGHVIGHLNIKKDSEEGREDTKELGYLMRSDCRRQGYMSEAVEGALEYLFENGIENVYVGCFCDNEASRRLIERLGFAFDQNGIFFAEYCNKELPTYEYVMPKALWQKLRKSGGEE